MDSLLASSIKFGAGVEVAAGPTGVGSKGTTADILAFSKTKGLFAGATIDGAVVGARDSWNEEYYGRPVRPMEILIERTVTRPQAAPLRAAVRGVAGSVS